jgi:hypothetical protein
LSAQDVVSNGSLIPQDISVIGTPIIRNIQFTIIGKCTLHAVLLECNVSVYHLYTAIPGQPQSLSVDRVEATSIRICWQAPLMADSPISFYSISARNLNSTSGVDELVMRNTTTNATFFTVTDLLPGTTYELYVVAVSQGGDVVARSQPSGPETTATDITGQ